MGHELTTAEVNKEAPFLEPSNDMEVYWGYQGSSAWFCVEKGLGVTIPGPLSKEVTQNEWELRETLNAYLKMDSAHLYDESCLSVSKAQTMISETVLHLSYLFSKFLHEHWESVSE